MPKGTKKLIVYLDQNFISEMAKADSNKRVKPEFKHVYELLHKGFLDERLVVPASWFHDVETSLCIELKERIVSYQNYLGQIKLNSPESVRQEQIVAFASIFRGDTDIDPFAIDIAFDENPDKRTQMLNVVVDSHLEHFDFKSRRMHTAQALESLHQKIIISSVSYNEQFKIEMRDRSEKFDYTKYQQVQGIVSGLIGSNPDIYLLKKDWEELVLLMKGNIPQYLEEEGNLLLGSFKNELENTGYRLSIGVGSQKNRIADIYQSFLEAFVSIQNAADREKGNANQVVEKAELLKINKSAVETYLNCGVKEDCEEYFNAYIQPLGETVLKSYLIKNYIFMDVVLATAKLVNGLGGNIDVVIPELNSIETILAEIKTIEQLKDQTCQILVKALSFRDSQTSGQHTRVIGQAKEYIDKHYMEPNLSLYEIASQVNLSSSHLSAVFSQGTCQTFKEYLTTTRINKAKEILRSSSLSSNDIAYQVGFNLPFLTP